MADNPSVADNRPCAPVGVIVPVFNRQSLVLETLDCVVRQTLLPSRLVVVDDGSTDGSASAVARWIRESAPPFETLLICQPHESAAAARNTGLKLVQQFSYVAFLDSDDRWPQDMLARTVDALKRSPSAVAATIDRRFVDSEGAVFRADDCAELASDPVVWIFRHGGGVASSTVLRTVSVLEAGGWNTNLKSSEDSWLFIHTALAGPWVHVPGAPTEFHQGNAATRQEENNLSHRHLDSIRRWASDYEKIYASIDGRYPVGKRNELRAALGVFWYRAGKQLDQLGRSAEARDCYSRALDWSPGLFRAWRRRLASQLFDLTSVNRWRPTARPAQATR